MNAKNIIAVQNASSAASEKNAVLVYEIHIFIISSSCFTFPYAANHFKNIPSSQLVCQLNRLERCIPGKLSIFLAFLIHRYKNPTPSPTLYLQNVYRKCSISTTLRKNRGPRTVYRHTASCGSLSCP